MVSDKNNFEELMELVEQERWTEVVPRVRGLDPADTADLLEELDAESRDTLFGLLDPETASDVLVELESAYVDDVVEDMESGRLAHLADHMAPDDAARLLAEMAPDQSAQVLEKMKEAADVSDLLAYEEDTAGNIMTTEFCAVAANRTVKDAREALVPMEPTDPVLYVYVTEPGSARLQGVISLKTLFTASPNTILSRIVDTDFVFCQSDEDQEEVARKFRKYDQWVMPVVDKHHRMVGRITVDDIMDVLHEEADEDLALMVGAPDIDLEEASPFNIARLRFPWLLITLVAGLINSVIIKNILDVTSVATIAIFVPAIMAMGGNTGIQSSAIAVRGIALGHHTYNRLLRVIGREVSVGIFLGLACGTIMGVTIYAVLSFMHVNTGALGTGALAITVGTAMCNAMIFATCFGTLVPILLHRFGIDPAVASGPFVTTSNDLSASLIYFLTCLFLLS